MIKLDYPNHHKYIVWRVDVEDEDGAEEYVETVWESENVIGDYVEMLNEGSNRYEYNYYEE